MTAWTEQINKHKVVLPAGITDSMNGKIPADLMSPVFRGDKVRFGYLAHPAARSFNAMVRDAIAAGVPAKSIDATDAFRDYATQVRIFNERYTTTPTKYHDGKYHTKTWNGKTYYQKPHTAAAAIPGASNHGKSLAVDKGDGVEFHTWLEVNAYKYGWEWELASEKWHLHYWPGDKIPQAVLDSEKPPPPIVEEEDDMECFQIMDGPDKGKIFLRTGSRYDWIPNADYYYGMINDMPDKGFDKPTKITNKDVWYFMLTGRPAGT